MNIFDLKVYNLAMEIGEKVWAIIHKWDYFEKDTVGKQLVRAVDSIAANLSEGFGRYHFKENVNLIGKLLNGFKWFQIVSKSPISNQCRLVKAVKLMNVIASVSEAIFFYRDYFVVPPRNDEKIVN